jgi:hypothetical protein
MKGTVDLSSSSAMVASTWDTRTWSSSAMRLAIGIMEWFERWKSTTLYGRGARDFKAGEGEITLSRDVPAVMAG